MTLQAKSWMVSDEITLKIYYGDETASFSAGIFSARITGN